MENNKNPYTMQWTASSTEPTKSELKNWLEVAVEKEEYEQAAKIRDKINKMKK